MSDSSEPTSVTLTSRREQRAGEVATEEAIDGRFWNVALAEEGEEQAGVHHLVFPWAERLWGAWRRLRQKDREHDLIYENRTLRSGGRFHPGVKALDMAGFDTSQLFATTSIVDTFKARMTKRKTMPMFVVDDAEWSLKRQAQDYRRWLHGKLSETEFDKLYPEIVNDMLARGDGVTYCDEGDDDVFVERAHRSELLIDPYEARQGEDAVRTMYRFRAVSRDALYARFPEEYHEAIGLAPSASTERIDDHASDWLSSERQIGLRDVVELVEVWHLPHRSCDPDEDGGGRKAVCLNGATLCYEEWKSPRFPFQRLSCYKPRRGYWSMGVVERLRPLQGMVNRMVADIAMNVSVTGKGVWVVPEQFDIPVEKLTGYRPFKIAYKGPRPPEFQHPVPVSPQAMDLLQNWIGQMHNLVGAAEWSAQGRSPLGAGASGIAIDTMEDLLSDRHAVMEENCAHYRLAVAQALLDAAGRVAARRDDEEYDEPPEPFEDEEDEDEDEEKPAKVEPEKKTRKRAFYATWMDKGRLERLDFNAVAMKEEQYRLQLEPVSFLPTTRAGKLAATSELIKSGVISQDQAASLYDEPDLAHVNRLLLAARHNTERKMEDCGDPKKPLPYVDEWDDLDLMLTMCKQYYHRAQNEKAPEDVLTRYRELGDLVLAVKGKATPPAPPPAPMGPDPMAGGPMPPGTPPGMPPGMDPAAGGMPPMGAPPL